MKKNRKPFTPTPEHIRNAYQLAYAYGYTPDFQGFGDTHAEFDRFLASVRAIAWDEGFDDGHYVNDTEDRNCGCRRNPYREGNE